MFEWWAELNPVAKYGTAFLFLGLAVAELVLSNRFRAATWGIGIVLLCFAMLGPGDSDNDDHGRRFK